jgi:hypothetical protein
MCSREKGDYDHNQSLYERENRVAGPRTTESWSGLTIAQKTSGRVDSVLE